MFGLMKRAPRLPYCGTCKALGGLYGQRMRMLLNHDIVFLAELLMSHAGEPEWTTENRSFNCFSIPRESPLVLEYAATVSVLLGHFRIADQRADSKKLRWRLAARVVSPNYRKAAARLRAWEFPLDQLESALASQSAREARPESLAHVAEPTAIATGLVFSHGARIAGRPEVEDSMRRIGHRFGELIYTLDAYEDRARDARTGDFNPLRVFPEVDARAEILAASAEIQRELPPELAMRLRTNVEERLGLRLRVLCGSCRKSARERWREAVAFARSIRDREKAGLIKGAAVIASVSLLAFFFPHQARSGESWRHTLGVGLNLMALGSIFANVQAPPPAVGAGGPAAPGEAAGKVKSSRSCCGGGGGSNSCDCCDCCICGDCCCDCGDCCSCCDC